MKRVLKTLILLTILGAVAAYLWKRWQSRAPGPLWREADDWPVSEPFSAGMGPATSVVVAGEELPVAEEVSAPSSEDVVTVEEAAPRAGPAAEEFAPAVEAPDTGDEPDVAPALPDVVAAAPLAAAAEFEEMLAEDRLLEAIEPIEAEDEAVAPTPAPPAWSPPPAPVEIAPVAEPAYLAPVVEPEPAVEAEEPVTGELEPAPAISAEELAAPPERWYWPWQRRQEPAAEVADAAAAPAVELAAAPGPAVAAVEEAEAAAEVEDAARPEAEAPLAEPEPALEAVAGEVEARTEGIPLAAPDEAAPGGIAGPEPVASLPEVPEVPEVPETPLTPASETEAEAEELEPWADETAARQEGGFRWPWQRDDMAAPPAPVAEAPSLEQLADELDGFETAVEPETPPAPAAPPAERESGGFRWPWQKRKEEELPVPAPPAVDQAEFEETGLSWGITDEDESVAAEWLETAPGAAAEPAAFVPPTAPPPPAVEPEPSRFFEQGTREAAPEPPPAVPLTQGMPLTNALEAAIEHVRPEPVAQYAGRSAESFLDEGNVYFNVGQYGLAIERYTHAVELDPNLTAGYYNRANARTRAGEYDLALDDYNSALELEPNDADALNNRGMLHLYRAGYGSALRDFNAALQIDPTDTTVIVNRGLAQLHGGDPAAALVDFQEAAALDDTDAAAHYGAAQAASALGNREESLRRLRRALQIDPAYAREAAADAKLVPLQGDAEFMRILREAGSRR
ncbi:MAG: tetratricopeptide repeat protein [Dehalococcoidia bacterium]|nr:tetratricopeptide repeat protein [Dehalococcoidia bacterium]